jgi:DNA-binding NtrC family response regulator
MREGACDYLVKPVSKDQFSAALTRAYGIHPSQEQSTLPAAGADFPNLVTRDPQLLELLRRVKAVARSGQPVLITGETGVGKEPLPRRCT